MSFPEESLHAFSGNVSTILSPSLDIQVHGWCPLCDHEEKKKYAVFHFMYSVYLVALFCRRVCSYIVRQCQRRPRSGYNKKKKKLKTRQKNFFENSRQNFWPWKRKEMKKKGTVIKRRHQTQTGDVLEKCCISSAMPIHDTATDSGSRTAYRRNCTKIITSSAIVPSEPINQGRLVRK